MPASANIKSASTAELKSAWDAWMKSDSESMDGHAWHYDDIHLELNLRGEGEYCAI